MTRLTPLFLQKISRRRALHGLGLGLIAVPVARALSACDAEDLSGEGEGEVTTGPWATGGTAAMTAAATYPDPFTSGLDDGSCTLTCTLTLGPCYAPTAPKRQDCSEGEPGIPMRLALRVVEADGCDPVVGAELEIWHCNIDGLYSGDDVNQGSFCTADDEHAIESYFFRARAIADDNGVVVFDSTFPGWYPSRAIHIHFLVRRAAFVGGVQDTNAAVVSQLFFDETLTAEIFNDVDGYKQKGQPDTSLSSDTVIGNDDPTPYIVQTARMSDGAMLAFKTIAISDDDSCGSSGGGGGPGGPPP